MQNNILFRAKNFTVKGPENEDVLNNSVTTLINKEIPEGYRLKQVVSCNVNYDRACCDEWMVRIIFILEKI